MKKQDTIIAVKEHGTAYYINKYGRFAGYPINTDGSLDKGGEMEIEESPISDKGKHEEVLKKLGVPEGVIPQILKQVHYY